MHSIHNTLEILTYISEWLNYVVAFFAVLTFRLSAKNFKAISIYGIALPLLVAVKNVLWPWFHVGNRIIDNLLIVPIGSICMSLFFYYSFKKIYLKRGMLTFLTIFLTIYLIDIFFFMNIWDENPNQLTTFLDASMVIFFIIALNQLLKESLHIKIEHNTLFWFIIAKLILFFTAILIDLTSNIWSYSYHIASQIYALNNLFFTIHSIVMIVGYLYLYRSQKRKTTH